MIRLCEYQGDASLGRKALNKLLSEADEHIRDLVAEIAHLKGLEVEA